MRKFKNFSSPRLKMYDYDGFDFDHRDWVPAAISVFGVYTIRSVISCIICVEDCIKLQQKINFFAIVE